MLDACYGSVAAIAITPLQDILGLYQTSRMNVPASKKGNWRWRVYGDTLSDKAAAFLRLLVKKYNCWDTILAMVYTEKITAGKDFV